MVATKRGRILFREVVGSHSPSIIFRLKEREEIMHVKNKSKDAPFLINAVINIENVEFYSLDYFRDLYPNAEITSIDGKDVIGKCVSCEIYLLDGDQTFDWTDEIACAGCEERRLKRTK